MRKLYSILLLVLIIISLCSCGNTESGEIAQPKLAREGREQLKTRFSSGKASEKDLLILFESEKNLLEKIALGFWSGSENASIAYFFQGKLVIKNDNDTAIDVSDGFRQLVNEYFEIVGSRQIPTINFVDSRLYDGSKTVQFKFRLPKPKNVESIILYSPEYKESNWKHIENDWYIFSCGLV